jgi:hypothetical protein
MFFSTDLSRIALEGHQQGATIYVAGCLADCAAARIQDLVRGLPLETRVVRLDLRTVHVIEFPERSARSAAVPLRLATHMASTANRETKSGSVRRRAPYSPCRARGADGSRSASPPGR